MAGVTISKSSGLNDSFFGKIDGPVKMLIQKNAEEMEAMSVLPYLFRMEKSDNYGEWFLSKTAVEDWSAIDENEATVRADWQEGYKKQILPFTWTKSVQITHDMIADKKRIQIEGQAEELATSYHRTRENFGAALYAGIIGGNTTVKYGGKTHDTKSADGVCVLSTSHPSKTKKQANQSNVFSNAFSADVLSVIEAKMRDFRGDTGEILDVAPDTILIPNNGLLRKAVYAAIGSDKVPGGSNNDYNFQFGRWRVIEWAYLNNFIDNSTSPFLVIDSRYLKRNAGAVIIDREAMTIDSHVDKNNRAAQYTGWARFGGGFVDWRFVAAGGISGGTLLTIS